MRVIQEVWCVPEGSRERFLAASSSGSRELVRRGIDLAGVSDVLPPYEMGRPAHHLHTAIFVLRGRAAFETDSLSGTVGPGDTLLLPAFVPHDYRCLERWRIVWFHITPGSRLWDGMIGKHPSMRRFHDIDDLRVLMRLYMDEQARHRTDSEALYAPLAEAITLCLERELNAEEPAERRMARGVVDGVLRRVQADLAHRWTVGDLAHLAGVSTSQLNRLCVAVHGVSPMRLLRRTRIEQAAALLAFSALTLGEIAARIGFETPFSLSRAFRDECGLAPKTYRVRCRDQRAQEKEERTP